MNRPVRDRLDDVLEACAAIADHIAAEDLPEAVVHDAVRMRLVEIGQAVRTLPAAVTATEPAIPWSQLSLLGERLMRRSVDTTPALVFGTARVDVPVLREATTRLRDRCD